MSLIQCMYYLITFLYLIKLYNYFNILFRDLLRFGIIYLDDPKKRNSHSYDVLRTKFTKKFEKYFHVISDEKIVEMLKKINGFEGTIEEMKNFIKEYCIYEDYTSDDITSRMRHFVLETVRIL